MRNIWDVIIVGSGPAGLFCAYTIRESNEKINILVIDKGPPVDERYCDSTCQCKVCHILSGGGGAGLFSDGKLTLDPSVGFKLNYSLPSNVLNGYIKLIEDTFLRFGHQGMLYYPKNKKIFERFTQKGLKVKLYPTRHIGSDEIRNTTKNFINFLEKKGVKFKWYTEVTEILNDPLGIRTKNNDIFKCRFLVMAVGRSGSFFLPYELKKLGISTLSSDHSSIGLRIECGSIKFKEYLNEAYDLKIEFKNCRTFCFCPHGEVILENYGKFKAVNGHTLTYRKTDYTNFAILVKTKEDIIKMARKINVDGLPLVQNLDEFIIGKNTKRLKILPTLRRCKVENIKSKIPDHIAESLCEFIYKIDEISPIIYENTIVYAPEVKFLIKPIKIDKKTFQTDIDGLYVIGDCSGYTASIIGASLSGMLCGKNILENG